MNKEKDLKFIKDFSKITIKNASKVAGIRSTSNLWTGQSKKSKVNQVKKFLIRSVLELLLKEYE